MKNRCQSSSSPSLCSSAIRPRGSRSKRARSLQPRNLKLFPPPDGTVPHPNESKFFIHLAEDQKNIWTSPFHLQPADAKWLVPMSGIATGLFVTDPQSSYAMRLDNQHALNIVSDAGVASRLGMTGAAYIWGHLTHNERARETGVLATEAIINAIGVDYALKGITGRERPFPSNFQNIFFHGGTSFPSDHAAVTWAFASVVAQEYPHPAAEFGAYGLALGVSLARAAADQHFLSDVFIGGLLGYQIGRHIYKTRHNPNIDDDLKIVAEQTSAPRPTNLASVYVPLDNWVYPAMERLIGGGYIDTAFHGAAAVDANVVRAHADRDERQGRISHRRATANLQFQEGARHGVRRRTRGLGWTADGIDATGFGLHARDGHCRNAGERQLSLRADADQRLRPALLAGRQQRHRIHRQRQRWPLRFLRGWRIPVRAYHSGISAVGATGDCECRLNPLQPPKPISANQFQLLNTYAPEDMPAWIFPWASKACGGDRAKAAPC